MPKFVRTYTARHSAKDSFELVADMERYPEFVPMCRNLIVCSRQQKGPREYIIADMEVAYKLVSETFTSKVVLDRDKMEIEVHNVNGPFRYLYNQWIFTDIDSSSGKVHFSIDYEFKSRILGLVMGNMFDHVFSGFIDSFGRRADEVYGVEV